MRCIVAIMERDAIREILRARGLPEEPPEIASPRQGRLPFDPSV